MDLNTVLWVTFDDLTLCVLFFRFAYGISIGINT